MTGGAWSVSYTHLDVYKRQIIGGAFTSIVTSLVNDIINPILGVFGGMNFDQLSVKLFGEATLYYRCV